MQKPSGSSAKAKVLFLSPEAPYPVRGGGPLRSASLLEYLASRFQVHAIVFRQPGEPPLAQFIPPNRIQRFDVVELPGHSKHPIARALRNTGRLLRNVPPLMDRFAGFGEPIRQLTEGQNFAFAVVEHFWCAPYVEQLRPSCARVILDLHNVESLWHETLAESESAGRAWALKRFARACAALEHRWLPQFDDLLVTSAQDAQRVRGMAPGLSPIVYPNALPEMPPPVRAERNEIAFSGNLEYQPNVSAVRFFRERVWPSLRGSNPDLAWRIIGKNPQAIRSIAGDDPRIIITGPVEDAVVELAAAKIAVVPVLAGSGTRIKILEAWAAGTPVVSTPIGAEGLDCVDQEHLLIADTAARFAAAIQRLLDSTDERLRIGAAGRCLYETLYTWPRAWKTLEQVFHSLG